MRLRAAPFAALAPLVAWLATRDAAAQPAVADEPAGIVAQSAAPPVAPLGPTVDDPTPPGSHLERPTPPVGDRPPVPPRDGKPYSPYELDTIAEQARAAGFDVDPAPEGKIVEAVIIRPLDVLERRDPLPTFAIDILNFFHATSRPYTVRRELLLREGEPWRQVAVDETARNLRSIRQFSVVLCVPLVGSAPDRVRLLVITKDIWSLRLNSDFRIAGGGLESLLLAPSEENLFGSHHSASARFTLDPATYSVGLGYRVPRIAQSRIETSISANLIWNRDSGVLEGSTGRFAYGQPLWSTRTPWAWGARLSWASEIARRFVGGEVATFDADATPDDDRLPFAYRSDVLSSAFFLTKSHGWPNKNDLTLGVESARSAFRLDAPPSRFDPAAVAEFERRILPVSDTRIYPFLGWNAYATDFRSLQDFNTLGLLEDYRMGHDLYVKAYPVLEGLGSTRSFAGLALGAAYTVPLGDGLVRVYGESITEAEADRIADASIFGGARVVSPRLGFGRLVVDGVALDRVRNHLNRRSTLGGDTRLRGYPSGALFGENVIAYNAELRTRPLELWTVQVGAVAFFDAGAAFDDGEAIDVLQGAGAGLRVLFPQLDRTVMRFDWGVPLQLAPELGVERHFPGEFVLTFKQAFPMPGVAAPTTVP